MAASAEIGRQRSIFPREIGRCPPIFPIRGNARNTALVDFGWTANDIIAAIQKLKISHFYKSEPSDLIENCMIDYYKASELNKEAIYIHFYVRENRLVINSFKKL